MSQPDSARSLVVEDTIQNIRVVGAILKRAGVQISSAKNGTQGLAIAAKSLCDLNLIHILPPPVDGFAVYRHFKCAARGPVEQRGNCDTVTARRATGGA